jgi:hypothetical protein
VTISVNAAKTLTSKEPIEIIMVIDVINYKEKLFFFG